MVRGRGNAMTVVLVALLGLAAFAWFSTPGAGDVQPRALALAAAHHSPVLSRNAVPKLLADAIVATEDERFWIHHGLDVVGLGRALLYDVTNRCLCEGGSTITQQLAKILYLNGDDRGLNKLRDMVLALKIENQIDKQQILADYLSVVYVGDGKWGMEAASCAYFHTRLDRLDLPQYALLAGLPQAPSIYDPLVNPPAAMRRRSEVLQDMRADGYITAAQLQSALKAPLLVRSGRGC